MRVISLRRGYECDHSTKDYGYISGIKVYYDYGKFDMDFAVPYNTDLFKLLKKYKGINAEKKFNKIKINLYLYCDSFSEDEYEYAELALQIRDAIINKDLDVVRIINAYHEQKNNFLKIKVKSALGKRLQKVLTVCW